MMLCEVTDCVTRDDEHNCPFNSVDWKEVFMKKITNNEPICGMLALGLIKDREMEVERGGH